MFSKERRKLSPKKRTTVAWCNTAYSRLDIRQQERKSNIFFEFLATLVEKISDSFFVLIYNEHDALLNNYSIRLDLERWTSSAVSWHFSRWFVRIIYLSLWNSWIIDLFNWLKIYITFCGFIVSK